jgi:glutathione S-transferase
MKLYHHPLSSNARKAVITASLLGADVELVVVDLATGENQSPEYRKINPGGKVPTLTDGDLTLWESHAIMLYLADGAPGSTLWPSGRAARADITRWLFWSSAHWGSAIAVLVAERFVKRMRGKGDPEPALVAHGLDGLARHGALLDAHLEGREFVAGDTLTLADIAIAAPLMYAPAAQLPIEGFAGIQRWFATIRGLDAWKSTEPGAAGAAAGRSFSSSSSSSSR